MALQEKLMNGAVNAVFLQPKSSDPPGMGSRGKRRFYALATWRGAKILREAKPVVPSAMAWARAGDAGPGLAEMLTSPRRCPDPFRKSAADGSSAAWLRIRRKSNWRILLAQARTKPWS